MKRRANRTALQRLFYHSDFSLQNLSENWRSSWRSGVVFSRLKPLRTRITTGFLISDLINRLHCRDEMVHHSLAVLSSAKFY